MAEFGHKKRAATRQKRLRAIKSEADEIIRQCWDNLIPTLDTAQSCYSTIIGEINQKFTNPNAHLAARLRLNKFVRALNHKTGAGFPEPSLPVRIKRSPPALDRNWIVGGQRLKKIVYQAFEHWGHHTEHNYKETLGWVIFSAAINGLNDSSAQLALIQAIHKRQIFYALGDNQLPIIFLRAENKSYGNELVDGSLYCTWQYIPDPLTLIWLIRAYQHPKRLKNFSFELESLLNAALRKITKRYTIQQLNASASYLWINKPGSSIDTAMTQVMRGKTQNCSLTVLEFARYIADWNPVNQLTIDLVGLMQHPGSSVFSDQPNSNHRTQFTRGVTTGLRNALTEKNPTKRMNLLNELYSQTQHEGARRLVGWVQHLNNPEFLPKLKTSSIRRYVDAVGHAWLAMTAELNINELGSQDFTNLYQEILEISSERSRAYDSGRLKQFHTYQMSQHSAPEAQFDNHNQLHVCRARLIGPSLYSALLSTLSQASGISEHNRSMLRLIFILAYRTGMRREEIIGLQLRDVEAIKYPNLLVRPNIISSTKTSSAIRRILISALLKSEEFLEFTTFWQRQCLIKSNRPNAPLFTLENSDAPVSSQLPYLVMRLIFNEIMGKHDYVFHSFRHTALSNLGLILSDESGLTAQLTDYTPQDVDRIQYCLLGTITQGTDRWYALANLAGHLNPSETFRSYLHLIHLQAGVSLHQKTNGLPISAVVKISGLSESTVRRLLPSGQTPQSTNNLVDLSLLRPTLTKKLRSYVRRWEELEGIQKAEAVGPSFDSEHEERTPVTTDQYDLMLTTLPGHPGNPVSMELVYNLLHKIEHGATVGETSTNYGLLEELVQRWVDRAEQLAQLKTSRGQCRLYTNERLLNYPDRILTPGRLTSISQTQQAHLFFQSAVKMHQEKPEKLMHFLEIFINRVTPTKSSIPFKSNENEQLKNFLATGMQLLPSKNWRIESKNKEALLDIKRELGYRLLNTNFKSELDNTGFLVSIIHPQEDKITEKSGLKTYSSGVLKYCCQMIITTKKGEIFNA